MEPRIALVLSGAFAVVGVFAGWRGARPFDPRKGPRMVPWRFIMVLAAAGAITLLFQAAELAGLRPPGR